MNDFSPSNVERHPLPPFFTKDAEILFLGSFPPPRNRWCMDFFYPNLQNDFWRILGLIFFGEREHFLTAVRSDGKRIFDAEKIREFLLEKKIALYDTAEEVIRKKGNASDAFLEIVTPLDLKRVLTHDLPKCRTIFATGEKAAETLLQIIAPKLEDGTKLSKPAVGKGVSFRYADRILTLCRLPSSSRAYPLSLEKKAEIYGTLLRESGFLPQTPFREDLSQKSSASP